MWDRSGVGPMGPIKPLGPGGPGGPNNPGSPGGPSGPESPSDHSKKDYIIILYCPYSKYDTVSLPLGLCVLPGGPGRPGGPVKNTGDVRIFSLVICSGTSALFDSMAILHKDVKKNK